MEKTFSKIEISVIKSTAKNVAPFVAKKAKVDAQIEETKLKIQKALEEKLQKLEAEKAGYQSIIDSMNSAVKQITAKLEEAGFALVNEGLQKLWVPDQSVLAECTEYGRQFAQAL